MRANWSLQSLATVLRNRFLFLSSAIIVYLFPPNSEWTESARVATRTQSVYHTERKKRCGSVHTKSFVCQALSTISDLLRLCGPRGIRELVPNINDSRGYPECSTSACCMEERSARSGRVSQWVSSRTQLLVGSSPSCLSRLFLGTKPTFTLGRIYSGFRVPFATRNMVDTLPGVDTDIPFNIAALFADWSAP